MRFWSGGEERRDRFKTSLQRQQKKPKKNALCNQRVIRKAVKLFIWLHVIYFNTLSSGYLQSVAEWLGTFDTRWLICTIWRICTLFSCRIKPGPRLCQTASATRESSCVCVQWVSLCRFMLCLHFKVHSFCFTHRTEGIMCWGPRQRQNTRELRHVHGQICSAPVLLLPHHCPNKFHSTCLTTF